MLTLLLPEEVDKLLRLSPGRSARLARRGMLPHIRLPDGTIRFDAGAVEKMIAGNTIVAPINRRLPIKDTRVESTAKCGSPAERKKNEAQHK
jgi:hypothetical protein